MSIGSGKSKILLGEQQIFYNLSRPVLISFLSIYLGFTAGCSDSAADAAKSAAQAEVYLSQNQIPEARLAIRDAILARDDVSDYHILRGRIEFSAESFESAYLAYSDALALNPTNQEALQAISQLGLRIGRYNESVEATNKLLVLNPNLTDAILIRGLHALIKRDFDDALASSERILSIDRFNEGGVVLKARASFLSGDEATANSVLDDFENSRPNTQAVALTRLEIYRELRDADQMNKQFGYLEELRPDDHALRLDQANFLFKTGRAAQAIEKITFVMASKDASAADIKTATSLWSEYSVTKIPLQHVKSIATSGTSAARIAGAHYFTQTGDTASANSFIDGMAGVDVDAERASIALVTGRKALAGSLSKAILETDETHCSALKTQAILALSNVQHKDALRSAQKASSECPDQPDLWQLTAQIYSALGDKENVRRVFRQGIDANKQSQALARAYSNWLLSQGSSREALAVARRITRSAPALSSGWRLYAEICVKAKSSCVAEAEQGKIVSQTEYSIDLLPGQLPPNGLFGRFSSR